MSINIKHDIKPISYIKANASEMVEYVAENRNPIVITQNGEAKAVLVDINSYQEMQDAFNLLKIIRLAEQDIDNGKIIPADKVIGELKRKYGIGE
ncbi:MAG: type II toxin-antitoxin system Phd/YefM family antitoxin [Spirochaetales bacterium]|nr:type II toxin-antitoxin system Phd/YefM family antitoxin [Spirochaetales bacterium]